MDLSKALGALEEAVGTDDSSEALTLFGRALLLTQDVERAERMLQQATEKLPVDPLAFYYLADAAERRGNPTWRAGRCSTTARSKGTIPTAARRAALAVRIADLSLKPATAPAPSRGTSVRSRRAAPMLRCSSASPRRSSRAATDAARATVVLALERDPLNRAAVLLQRRIK